MLPLCLFLFLAPILLNAKFLQDTRLTKSNVRVIGGEDESIENAPWQVSIQLYGFHICGGSIYSSRIIVTAGHCLPNIGPLILQYTVRVGSSKYDEGGQLIPAGLSYVHPKYDCSAKIHTYDIGLVGLKEPIEMHEPTVRSITLATSSPNYFKKATLTGWGMTSSTDPRPAKTLQSVNVTIQTPFSCLIYGGIKGTICAGNQEKTACNGDSGGPLVVDGELSGIVSFGSSLCNAAAVYVNVADLNEWITDVAKNMTDKLEKKATKI